MNELMYHPQLSSMHHSAFFNLCRLKGVSFDLQERSGTVFNLISGGKIGLALSYSIGQAAPMVATLWGIAYYREFAGAGARTVLLVLMMFVLYFGAIALVALSKQE